MNLFINLKENKDLSKNERILADYILKHPEDVLKMSSKDLGKECFVSTATVYRLCDKLGLSGFSDLKIKITSSLDDYRKSNEDFNFDFPVNQFQTHYEIIQKIKEDYEQTLNLTANLFSLDQLRLIASAMEKAQIIDVYTSAGNINFALNFQFQMQEINQLVTVPKDDYIKSLTATNSDSSHLAFVISFGGRGSSMEAFCKILKKNQVPIILLTSTQGNPLTAYADDIIYMASSENHYNKMSSFSTRMPLLYLLDSLYSLYFQLNYDQNLAFKLEAYERMTKTKKE